MSLPRHLGPPDPGSGRGPFGEKGFRGALIGCAVLVVAGLPLVVATGGTPRSIGTVLLALGVLGRRAQGEWAREVGLPAACS